jgi:hypothetical protein
MTNEPTLRHKICGMMFPMFGEEGTVTTAFIRYLRNKTDTTTTPIM